MLPYVVGILGVDTERPLLTRGNHDKTSSIRFKSATDRTGRLNRCDSLIAKLVGKR